MSEKSKTGKVIGEIFKFVLPLVVSVGLCYLLFTGIDFRQMLTIIRDQCRPEWIAVGWVFAIGAQVLRALRWRLQLTALGIKPPLTALVLSIFGTYAVNLVFPRLGEVWRSGYIAKRQSAPFTSVFGSMVADRLSDTAAVLLMALWAFFIAQRPILSYLESNGESYAAIGRVIASPWIWGALLLCVCLLVAFMKIRSSNVIVVRVQKVLNELWQGFIVILRMPGRMRWLLFTIGLWGCYFTQTALAFFAFPFTETLLLTHGLSAAFVVFVLGSISMGVPSNGGIGPWQWAVIFGLGIYGLPSAEAGAFANLVLATTTLLTILLGIATFVTIALDKRRHNTITTSNNTPNPPTNNSVQ